MSTTDAERLEYLESIEFPTPNEFAELRALLAAQTDAFIAATREQT